MKILIVDDNSTNRVILEKFLEPFGECQVAENGYEALKMVRSAYYKQKPFQLICLDIMMPVMDGQEALKNIRSFESDNAVPVEEKARIIMTTALDDKKNIDDAFDSGCEAYLVKPVSKPKLVEELHKLGLVEESTVNT